MTTLKYFLISIATLISMNGLAGGGGGGGVMSAMAEKHMVYFQSEDNGLVKFSSATLDQNKWIIQKHSIGINELESNAEALTAIELSKQNKSWTAINPL